MSQADEKASNLNEPCFSCEKAPQKYVSGLCQSCHELAWGAPVSREELEALRAAVALLPFQCPSCDCGSCTCFMSCQFAEEPWKKNCTTCNNTRVNTTRVAATRAVERLERCLNAIESKER